MTTATAGSVEDVREALLGGSRVLPVGAGTKPALSTPPDGVVALDVRGLRGILEYDPAELTVTARAGTPVAELDAALAEHGQHLPFDPPLAAAGATLGGVVAAGTSGSGAFAHGGVRDFVLGVRLVDGTGTEVAGGGRVVKNAAGFDLPKLVVGSAGALGVLVQLSLKVFPRPRARRTLVAGLGDLAGAVAGITALAGSPLELDALDLEPPGRVLVRLAGDPAGFDARTARVGAVLGGEPEVLDDAEAAALWDEVAGLAWAPAGTRVVRVGLTHRAVGALQAALDAAGARARYAAALNAGWIAWPHEVPVAELGAVLGELGLTGMALTGPPHRALLGRSTGGAFARRITQALDPESRLAGTGA